jgi:carbamoyl-phosphate synthase small subunit
MHAILVLADGTIVEGKGFGAIAEAVGEVVFNTGMTGYTEMLTDPSYKGQILMLTFPPIGNYAIPPNFESDGIKPEGFIVKEACKEPSHWQSDKTISEWLSEEGVPGIEGVDTRALTRKIREYGVLPGVLATYKDDAKKPDVKKLLDRAKKFDIGKIDLVAQVATKKIERFNVNGKKTAALIDCGVKQNIIRELNLRKINVIVFPPNAKADGILQEEVDGLVISNGPGDPAAVTYVHETVRKLLEELPILGICLGHQILALAAGARTYKLKFGHRGVNHPVKEVKSDRVYITTQNHGYAVDASSMDGAGLKVTMINANDGTVEGMAHKEIPMISVQYHPEASPGPMDNKHLFDEFVKLIEKR